MTRKFADEYKYNVIKETEDEVNTDSSYLNQE